MKEINFVKTETWIKAQISVTLIKKLILIALISSTSLMTWSLAAQALCAAYQSLYALC